MKHPTILLIEDNPDDVELTLRAFREQTLEVHVEVARDGAEAIECLAADSATHDGQWPPHVILLDLNLPKLSGIEVLRHIRSHTETQRLPVIVLTTSNDAQERSRCYEIGASSFIRKPVAYERFMEVIKQLGIYWTDINMPPPHAERPYA
uniref:Putative Two component signal transduction response regulator n=1 Tax=Magnetococcus massalia (strain MO-1) TaxID=451514 RepID=A0A1S7LIB4_MAGMO|nr:putative Two component signal transduction response regulator [Candidatus Magnetococcus massalia]